MTIPAASRDCRSKPSPTDSAWVQGEFSCSRQFYNTSNWSSLVTVKQDHELILRGPYAVVRHPIYSGFLLALTGTAIAVGEILAFIGLGLAFIGFLLKSAAEEKFMREEFSTEYARYSQRVRRLIPFVF